jgi:hypothetical protein
MRGKTIYINAGFEIIQLLIAEELCNSLAPAKSSNKVFTDKF